VPALQAALSVVLLVGAGLFVRSLQNVRGLDLGYDAERIAFATVDLRGAELTRPQRRALHDRMVERLATLPEVERSATTLTLPFYMNMNMTRELFVPGIDSVDALGTLEIQRQAVRCAQRRALTAHGRYSASMLVISSAFVVA
jgi:putative ABC transport system permease protein